MQPTNTSATYDELPSTGVPIFWPGAPSNLSANNTPRTSFVLPNQTGSDEAQLFPNVDTQPFPVQMPSPGVQCLPTADVLGLSHSLIIHQPNSRTDIAWTDAAWFKLQRLNCKAFVWRCKQLWPRVQWGGCRRRRGFIHPTRPTCKEALGNW